MYGELLDRLADDLDAGGPTVAVLRGHEDDPGPSGLALRLVGSVHRLVLDAGPGPLAAFYPTVGGTWHVDGWPVFRQLLADEPDEVRTWLDRAPQTNEVGRAAALIGGAARPGTGCRCRCGWSRSAPPAGSTSWPTGSATSTRRRLGGARRVAGGARPGLGRRAAAVADAAEIVERGGCDISPVDVDHRGATDPDGVRLAGQGRTGSSGWPGAIALAKQVPLRRTPARRRDVVDGLAPSGGHLTVLWHSVMWQYVPRRPAGAGHGPARGARPHGDRGRARSCTCSPSPRGVRPRRSTGSGSGRGPGRGPASGGPGPDGGARAARHLGVTPGVTQ